MLKSADKSESLLGAGQSLCARACGPRHLCWGGPAVCRGRGHAPPVLGRAGGLQRAGPRAPPRCAGFRLRPALLRVGRWAPRRGFLERHGLPLDLAGVALSRGGGSRPSGAPSLCHGPRGGDDGRERDRKPCVSQTVRCAVRLSIPKASRSANSVNGRGGGSDEVAFAGL